MEENPPELLVLGEKIRAEDDGASDVGQDGEEGRKNTQSFS